METAKPKVLKTQSNMVMSIGFSLFVCGLAAANLALDFDFIERGIASGLPKSYEWVAGSNHHHLHCVDCGSTVQLDEGIVSEFSAAVLERHGFESDATHMVLNGVCASCRDE